MEIPFKSHWKKISGTNIYTTGHYVVEIQEIKSIFTSDAFESPEIINKIESNQPFSVHIKTDRRIVFNFIPLKTQNKYLIEGYASSITLDEIKSMLPRQLKRILVEKRRVKYLAG